MLDRSLLPFDWEALWVTERAVLLCTALSAPFLMLNYLHGYVC